LLSINLLRLSELDSKSIREQATKFSLDEQIRKSILILEADWTKKNLNLDIDLEKISYLGDEHLLQQVWLNLIQNAIKFSNQNGVLRVALALVIFRIVSHCVLALLGAYPWGRLTAGKLSLPVTSTINKHMPRAEWHAAYAFKGAFGETCRFAKGPGTYAEQQ